MGQHPVIVGVPCEHLGGHLLARDLHAEPARRLEYGTAVGRLDVGDHAVQVEKQALRCDTGLQSLQELVQVVCLVRHCDPKGLGYLGTVGKSSNTYP